MAPRAEETGATATEYGLLIAGVAALSVIAIVAFGGTVLELFDDTCSNVASENSSDCN